MDCKEEALNTSVQWMRVEELGGLHTTQAVLATQVAQATQPKKRRRPPGSKDGESGRMKANHPPQVRPGTLLTLVGEL